jgi:hypothetical protein
MSSKKKKVSKKKLSTKKKQLSNPFSTGSGGAHFEAHVQASFVALMLTGGYAPTMPCWPIAEVKLQGKVDGFDTDDLIVFVQDYKSDDRRKLLGQVKHAISFVKSSSILTEVMQAAWDDFNNASIFTKNKDQIALITGPLKEADFKNVSWILDQAKHTKDSLEFFSNVNRANFSPSQSGEKLDVIKHHLKIANGGTDVSDNELYDFLNHFHLLGYDLGKEVGVVLSLLHSHISQFELSQPEWAFSRIVDIVQSWNQSAGTITIEKLPDDVKGAFKEKIVGTIPPGYSVPKTPSPVSNWNKHEKAVALTMALLIGEWDENNPSDIDAIRSLSDEV